MTSSSSSSSSSFATFKPITMSAVPKSPPNGAKSTHASSSFDGSLAVPSLRSSASQKSQQDRFLSLGDFPLDHAFSLALPSFDDDHDPDMPSAFGGGVRLMPRFQPPTDSYSYY